MNMVPTRELLLESVSPGVRDTIKRVREQAEQGRLLSSLDLLDSEARHRREPEGRVEWLALTMARAELLFLDFQVETAASVFRSQILPVIDRYAPTIAYISHRNAAEVEFAKLNPKGNEALREFTRTHEIKLDLLDYKALLTAEGNAAEGQHAAALEVFERELARTQAQACWAAYRAVAHHVGAELLRVGRLVDAAATSVVSHDHKLSAAVGEGLMKHRDGRLIRESVLRLLSVANLLQHFAAACALLAEIGDAIPDDLVDTVAQWLLPRCSLPVHSSGKGSTGPLNMAWKALEPIGERLSADVAGQVLYAAINHAIWNQVPESAYVLIEREQIVEAMAHCVYSLRTEDLSILAREAVPLALGRRQNHDFPKVVNLLCHVADRAGGETKAWIGDQLFQPGQPVTYLVGQVAANFGKEFVPPDRMGRAAEQVAANLRLQVQRVDPAHEPMTVPGTLMTFNETLAGQKVVVSLVQGVELHTMASHRRAISADALRHLIDSAVSALTDRENSPTNRASIIHGLMEFGDSLPEDLAESLLGTLEILARGEIEESASVDQIETPHGRLNRRTFGFGSPSDVRRIAVVAFARIGSHWLEKYGPRIQAILEQALTDLDPNVRRYAFAAAREVPRLSAAAFVAVLLGTRDTDPSAAASAFAALATKRDISLQESDWLLVLYAAKMALQSPSPQLRRTVTGAIKRLQRQAPTQEIRAGMTRLLEASSMDICFSVRQAVQNDESDA
jgi:hypothetical protein